MTYNKQTWKTGDVITQEKLNHIEDGIVSNDTSKVDRLQASFASSPSSTPQSITIGTTGSTLITPANGTLYISGRANVANSFVSIYNSSAGETNIRIFTSADQAGGCSVRCSQGQTLKYDYYDVRELRLKFIPNNGDV